VTKPKPSCVQTSVGWTTCLKNGYVLGHFMYDESLLYFVAILDSRCGRGNTKGYIPHYQSFSPAPPHHNESWQLATWSTWLLVILNRFRPPGTLVIWTAFSIRVFPNMQSDLTLLAAGISILLQYLNSSMEQSDRSNWTLHATRCENIEEIRKGCSVILECCGQTPFLSSIYKLWGDGFLRRTGTSWQS